MNIHWSPLVRLPEQSCPQDRSLPTILLGMQGRLCGVGGRAAGYAYKM